MPLESQETCYNIYPAVHICLLSSYQVTFALLAMFAMVKRCRVPADLEEAKAGGFVVDYTPAGAPIYRSPGAALFLSFLPNLLALIR